MYKIVLLRHGESTWNKENRFTGWTDVPLSEKGIEEAKEAGRLLKSECFAFDVVFTSFLQRATETVRLTLAELGTPNLPIEKSWRLNERHYGALQGLNKKETAEQYGDEQLLAWRRGYAVLPPALSTDDPRHPIHDALYKDVDPALLPATESLKLVVDRFLPYWRETIAPAIKSGKRALIGAHGNSLRALVKYLDNISDDDIVGLNIPTGVPLVYELDENLKPIRHYYLGNQDEIAAKTDAVANQAK